MRSNPRFSESEYAALCIFQWGQWGHRGHGRICGIGRCPHYRKGEWGLWGQIDSPSRLRNVPSFQWASGDTREARVYWAVPTVPSCPHKKQMWRHQGGNPAALSEGGQSTVKRGRNGEKQTRAPGPRDCLRTRQAPADCQTCGTALVTIRHTPMRLPGSHCSRCCPCCAAEGVPSAGPGSEGAPGSPADWPLTLPPRARD